MKASDPQSAPRFVELGTRCLAAVAGLAALVWVPGARADSPAPQPAPEGREIFGIESPAGRLEYHAGRGLRVGETGFTIGGFATAEAERLEDGSSFAGVDSANVFVFFDPLPFFHVFSEIETSRIVSAEDDRRGADSRPSLSIERVYGDLTAADWAVLRLGKFQTPIGRWNQVRIEPLLWTASDPLLVEDVFDDVATGAMLFGNLFPDAGAVTYSLYGTFFDPIAPDRSAPPAEHSAGARLEWTSLTGSSLGASYFASRHAGESWNHLGGVDGAWRPHDRLELSSEAIFGEGTQEPGGQWGLYVQAVLETVPTLYLVGRYERFDPPGTSHAIDLADFGFVWAPVDFVRLKADYRFADHGGERAAPGLRSSFSILF